MAGLINWGAPNSGSSGSSMPSGLVNWGDLSSQQHKLNDAADARMQQSRQQEQQQLQQQQQKPKQSFLGKTLGFAKTAAVDTGKAARAITRPIADVGGAIGQEIQNKPVTNAGKFVHDTAQLSSDVSGGTVNQFTKAVVNTPAAVGREIKNKPITDIQQKTFGTTKPGDIAKKIVASTVGTAATVAGGSAGGQIFGQGTKVAARELAIRAAEGAGIGGVGTAASVVNQNPSTPTKDVVKAAAKGAAFGAVAGAALPVVGKGIHEVLNAKQTFVDGPKALLDNVKANRVLNAGEEANKPVKIPVSGESTAETVPVKTPIHPAINEIKTADKVTVRTPQPMSDQEFTKQFNALSKNYEKDTKFLQQSSPNLAPKEVQALSDGLEAKHQGKLNDLIDAYNNPQLSKPVEPKPLKVAQDRIETPRPVAAKTLPNTTSAEKVPGAAPTAATAPTETVKVPQDQLPMGTGKEKLSRFAARMQGDLNNLTDEQKAAIPTYKALNNKENISAAAMYVDKHPDDVMPILLGEKAPPAGIHHTSIYLAAKAKGNLEDPDLARNLTSLAATRHGQEISLLREANPNDPITHMSDLRNTRIEAKGGEAKVRARTTAEVKAIRASTPRVTKDSWSSFVESLRC